MNEVIFDEETKANAQLNLKKDSVKFFELLAKKMIMNTPVVVPGNQNPYYWAYREGQNAVIRAIISYLNEVYK